MDGYRPNKLDMPIKGFHHDVNAVFTLLQRSADAIIFEAGASSDPFQIAGRSMTAIGREIRTTNRMKVWM